MAANLPQLSVAAPGPAVDRDRTRLWLLFVLVAFVATAFSPRDLWAPDEPRYGQVARETLDDGHWLVPHVNGAPYAEKPPLYYWIVALVSAPFGGVTALSARLAAVLLAIGAVALTARLGRRLFRDAALGRTAALVFASTVLALWHASRAALDLPLTFFVLLAVERAFAWWEHGRLRAAIPAGLAWAGAVLLKGPIGFLLPPLVFAGGAAWARRAPRVTNAGWWMMPVVLAGAGLAWLLPALASGGEAYSDRLLGQISKRASGAEGSHVRWVGYYIERGGALLLPWTMHVLAGLGVPFVVRRSRPAHAFGLGACAVGSLGLLLLLTSFATKREVYLMPGVPFAALLVAYAVHHDLFPRWRRVGRRLVVGCLAIVAVVLPAVPWALRLFPREGVPPAFDPPGVAAIFGATVAGLAWGAGAVFAWRARAHPRAFVRWAAIGAVAGAALAQILFLPLMDPVKSFRGPAEAARHAAGGGDVLISGWNQAPNLLWALKDGPVGRVEEPGDLAVRLAADAPRVAVVITEPHWTRVQAEVEGLEHVRETWRGRVGHRTLLVLTNGAP